MIRLGGIFGFFWLGLSWKQEQKAGKPACPDHSGPLVAETVVWLLELVTAELVGQSSVSSAAWPLSVCTGSHMA